MKRLLEFSVAAIVTALSFSPLTALATSNPCGVVSTGDAAKALGSSVAAAKPRTDGPVVSCSYRASGSFDRLVVTTMAFASPSDAKTQFHAMIASSMTYASPSTNLAGIGDEAHRLGSMIYVRKNETVYTFSTFTKDANGTGAVRTIAVAKSSIARMK